MSEVWGIASRRESDALLILRVLSVLVPSCATSSVYNIHSGHCIRLRRSHSTTDVFCHAKEIRGPNRQRFSKIMLAGPESREEPEGGLGSKLKAVATSAYCGVPIQCRLIFLVGVHAFTPFEAERLTGEISPSRVSTGLS
ncbi:hypothetical protein GY45DRAFT_372885 [Cubamyces sp. BRFM 1775]|nr:hypothetical protein GY45DRAFT_372885 [Cubamyces sp. BRFM 1775]